VTFKSSPSPCLATPYCTLPIWPILSPWDSKKVILSYSPSLYSFLSSRDQPLKPVFSSPSLYRSPSDSVAHRKSGLRDHSNQASMMCNKTVDTKLRRLVHEQYTLLGVLQHLSTFSPSITRFLSATLDPLPPSVPSLLLAFLDRRPFMPYFRKS